MRPKIPGQKEGRVKELIQEFEEKAKAGADSSSRSSPAEHPEIKKGHVSEAKAKLEGKGPFAADSVAHDAPPAIPTRAPSETSERGSDGAVDIVEITEEPSVVDPGTSGGVDAAIAGLKAPEGNITAHKSTQAPEPPDETGVAPEPSEALSTQTSDETGVASESSEALSTQTSDETGVATQTDPMKAEQNIENKPWKGLEKLKECFVGETGMKAGFLKLIKGNIAAGLRDMVTSLVMAPIHLAAMVLDGPRKIGDLASTKGQQLIDGSRGDFKGLAGVKAVLKHFAGGLLQAVGGAVRLAVPVAGLVVLMAIPPPPGWIIGGVLLGFYLIHELGAMVNEGPGELQTVRAGRDLVSGAMGIVGSVVEAVVKPIQALVQRVRGGAGTPESSVADSSDTVSLSDEDDAELADELAELHRAELEEAKADREAEVRDSMPDVSGLSVAERIARFERNDAREDE